MFSWFKKKKQKDENQNLFRKVTEDEMEESLWEIKEEYDLPTEEILNVVKSKRKNLDYLHKKNSQK
jgi:uncharacterized protein involved in tolerance to divalent cations